MKGFSTMIKFNKGELVSYKKSANRKLGIVLSDASYSNGDGWQVKTYCNGKVYNDSVSNVSKVCEDVEIIKPSFTGY